MIMVLIHTFALLFVITTITQTIVGDPVTLSVEVSMEEAIVTLMVTSYWAIPLHMQDSTLYGPTHTSKDIVL